MTGLKRILLLAALAPLGWASGAAAGSSTHNSSFDTNPRKYFLADFFDSGSEWKPGDTRYASYANQFGSPQLVAGRTTIVNINNQPATIDESALILERLTLVTGSAGPGPAPSNPDALGSLCFASPATLDKATIENRAFFADVSNLSGIAFTYTWYRTSGGVAAPALKIGIDTGDANPTDTTSNPNTMNVRADRGEDRIDKILVYEPYLQGRATVNDAWTTETIGASTGKFWLVNLTPNGTPTTSQTVLKTLAQWQAEAVLSSGTVKSLQIGVGSANPSQRSYVESLSYTNVTGSHTATDSTTWYFYPDPPPAGSISPSDAIIAEGDAATLDGSAVDAAGRLLSAGSLLWYSSRDGLFGSGLSATSAGLSPGIHEISLVTIDGGGESVGAAHTTIAVSAELAQRRADLAAKTAALAATSAQLAASQSDLAAKTAALAATSAQLAASQSDLAAARAQAAQASAQLAQASADLATARKQLTDAKTALARSQAQSSAYAADMIEMRRLLDLAPARRKREPNNGKTKEGQAVIARLLKL